MPQQHRHPIARKSDNLHWTLLFLAAFILCFFPHLLFSALQKPLRLFHASAPSTSAASPSPRLAPPPPPEHPAMSWFQKTFTLPAKSRGSYLITDTVVKELPEIQAYKVGILHLFVQHTSCGLSMNENWDSEVREDMTEALERIVPYDRKGDLYRHAAEGEDDMPSIMLLTDAVARSRERKAHIKSALVGSSVTIPISDGKLNTGTWQGIWYLEFRAHKHARKIVATIQGERKSS